MKDLPASPGSRSASESAPDPASALLSSSGSEDVSLIPVSLGGSPSSCPELLSLNSCSSIIPAGCQA